MDRSFRHTTTGDENTLIPVFLDEILPGDTVNITPTLFVRMTTPLHPIMDDLIVDFHMFFVQNRNIWSNWRYFMGEEKDPDNPQTYTVPTVPVWPSNNVTDQIQLADYLGIPRRNYQIEVNALPFRAMRFIFDEWYRDANLQQREFPAGSDGDGPDSPLTTISLFPRGKRKDYFTSCLPWPQAGDPVTLPLGSVGPVVPLTNAGPEFFVQDQPGDIDGLTTGATTPDRVVTWDLKSGGDQQQLLWSNFPGGPGLAVDLSEATAATINQIREAFQVQKLLERDARGGRRYSELILAHFGVSHPDAQWRPEFCGSFSFPVGVQQVPQTAQPGSGQEEPLGNLGAFAVGTGTGRNITKSFTEHGYLIGIASIRAQNLTYQQGLDRHWNYETRYDYYWPAFQGLGEQEVRNREIFIELETRDEQQETAVFGYQERYGHLRWKNNMVTGNMRSTDPLSLDTWHLAEEFDNQPVLNAEFVQEKTPVERVVAVQNERHFLIDCYFRYNHVRPLPMFGIPGLIDHF